MRIPSAGSICGWVFAREAPRAAGMAPAVSLGNLSDTQSDELATLFKFFDTDKDGLISPRSCTKLCERLGFHLEPASFAGDAGSTPLTLEDLLGWVNQFCGQCERSEELRLAQRFTLLRHYDVLTAGQKVSREALSSFLEGEQHVVTDEALDALLAEVGTNGGLTKPDLAMLIGRKRPEAGVKQRRVQLGPS